MKFLHNLGDGVLSPSAQVSGAHVYRVAGGVIERDVKGYYERHLEVEGDLRVFFVRQPRLVQRTEGMK